MNVAVLGGGYAGMAAAVTLAEAGLPVTVYEAASHLGGRARRVRYNGVALDNGLHVLIGACGEMLRLTRLVNRDAEDALLRLPLDWHMHDRFRLRVRRLPAPLHWVCALLTARGFSLRGRWTAARFLQRLRACRFQVPEDTSVAALLAAHRQEEEAIHYLWRPLCTSALNTPIEEASARIFLNVLRDGLDRAASSSDLLVARRDLSALFPEPAAEHVKARGGIVLPGHTVTAVLSRDGLFSVAAREEERRYTHVICALAPHRLNPIAHIPEMRDVVETVARFRYQPIHSVYLQYADRVRMPAPMVGIADGIAHWVFDREAICGQPGLLAAVISAGGAHQSLTQEDLAQRVDAEIRRHFGSLPALRWYRVIAEKRATFACTIGVERPSTVTALRNFYLAGDYVESDYPATLEGAVHSGVRAARAVLEDALSVKKADGIMRGTVEVPIISERGARRG